MAMFGVGAYFDKDDLSQKFIDNNVIGVGWTKEQAPALFQMVGSIKVGDIVYIKSFSPSSEKIFVRGIGIVVDAKEAKPIKNIISLGRNVRWLDKREFEIEKPVEKNNVRLNTMYEEFNEDVQRKILEQILKEPIKN